MQKGYENWPKATITEQKLDESPSVFRGISNGRPVWHIILVTIDKNAEANALNGHSTVDVTKFGRFIQYLNHRNEIKQMSGWGTDPPQIIQQCINKNDGNATVDENISLNYTSDDIRLCTMQRAIPQQKIGVYFLYSVPHRFHYIKLVEDFPSSLAQRAGIKSYDRVIFVNGVNIENDTLNQLDHRFDTERHLPFEMLVCSPATYEYTIKLTKMGNSHTDIPVISFDNKSFCAVRWENSNMISAVPQSAIFKSPEFTMLNDICVIEVDGQYRKGQIIFKGSQSDCEKWNMSSISSLINDGSSTMDNALIRKTFGMHSGSTSDETMTLLSSSMSLQNLESNTTISNVNEKNKVRHTTDASQRIPKSIPTTLEELPNELLYYLFTFLDIQHLHKAFWGLNSRLNNIFQS
ncbi:unnamed protein product [Rotaria magnacalcarata]|uniref:F-box domain-containing protein n=1 Tax=Rotaria magnacalcarata TaxID=392030 RepID=A0A816XNI2_9BILA|nr:unnamed protein product [Rotaria magnacalcarata]CAF2267668.1 unnamed protein product [Rotaria magnacalcarata]